MGFEGFDFVSPHEIFREHAQLTAHANDGRRALNLGAWANITAAEYKNWEPAAWPMAESRESARGPDVRATASSCIPTASARFVAADAARCRSNAPTQEYPAGAQHRPRARSLAHDDAHRQIRAPVGARGRALSPRSTPPTRCASRCAPASWRRCARAGARWWCACAPGAKCPPGMVFAPIHWNRAFASDARVGALTNPVVDPDLRRARAQAHARVDRAFRGRLVCA